ncbi:MAG: hypothetical protein A2091_07495 [Desulfuromonadales bacterium GWD2_61_12]|nr:MAG: hypothetical protein A2005_09565 [Desulfuromonadales bacterium GWC2_61_20]OGR36633.1 MAG: hypothetical protein A2091_07495 [Desulfuromonadales bacterium GWD2_61_12]
MRSYGIAARADDRFKVEVTAGTRTLIVDQPLAVGGSDAGATPIDHLLAALAGCLATTARIIASQRQLPLHGMAIQIDGALDLLVLAGKSAGHAGLSGLAIRVSLDAELAAAERSAFLNELRVRCPVYATIAATTPITLDAA